MESRAFASVADRIYSCQCRGCPLHQRIDSPGFFPKFGAGGTSEPLLGIVTMNPGAPDGDQRSYTRTSLARGQMHGAYDRGLRRYHREPRGGGTDIALSLQEHSGVAWDQVYYTEIAKCVTTKAEARDGTRSKALETCRREFLAEELSALPSLRALLCLGGVALESVLTTVASAPSLARFEGEGRIVLVPHPAAFGQTFRRSLPGVLARLRPILS